MLAARNLNTGDAGAALVTEFQSALKRVISQRRARMLVALAELFVAISHRIGDAEIAVFDDLLLEQFAITDHDTLVQLSKRLATLEKAPPRIIEKFASDDSLSIAGPVLSFSPGLGTGDLIRLAATRGQDHLHAICARAEIPEPLAAVLVKRGGRSVIDRLATTLGARFYAADFLKLLSRATADERGRIRIHQRGILQTMLGAHLADCSISNMSTAGAFLRPDTTTRLPENFALILTAVENRRARCRLARISDANLGVAFESDPFV